MLIEACETDIQPALIWIRRHKKAAILWLLLEYEMGLSLPNHATETLVRDRHF
ncbi:hypothetical protein VST04_28070 [Bacillus paranthracis]|uniref:hypothetical protein n=1 Tax=Bacillus paranthracis TaxID=2026186 RepID=UPI002DD41EB5|nr:hypothetical protein [Bacillus paranthracis]MEC4621953.1 hypothetical protein [Bacillus paranthracis]